MIIDFIQVRNKAQEMEQKTKGKNVQNISVSDFARKFGGVKVG